MCKWRGVDIELVNDVYVYSDTKNPVSEYRDVPCGHCGLKNTRQGYDGCLGKLPGVMNACCGHGNDNDAYIQYWKHRGQDDKIVRGKEARKLQKMLAWTIDGQSSQGSTVLLLNEPFHQFEKHDLIKVTYKYFGYSQVLEIVDTGTMEITLNSELTATDKVKIKKMDWFVQDEIL